MVIAAYHYKYSDNLTMKLKIYHMSMDIPWWILKIDAKSAVGKPLRLVCYFY